MATELLIAWLNDAYAMEQAQIKMLESFAQDFDSYPEIRRELHEHLVETKQQVADVRECIESLDGVVGPAATSSLSNLTKLPDALGSNHTQDRLIRNMAIMYANEHFEHVTYTALAAAARKASQDEIADMCERMAEEEIAMAEWLEEQIPEVVASCFHANRPTV